MSLNLAERVLYHDGLSQDECLKIFEDPNIDTFELLNEAYIVRKHYYGKKVKLNMILNAKSGICSEDCGYCGQSIKMKQKQRYALVDQDQIKAGAQVATNNQNSGQDVSRQGVQRDILPILEGSMIQTKYGTVNTEHMLFIGAGAFHVSKPSDLIPELQGRFPIRVELESLSVEDFVRILTEPKLSLVKQYEALLQTEEVTVNFSEDAIQRLAEIAYQVNQDTDNIGARRLHTILEKMLEDLSFEAPNMPHAVVDITPQYVDDKLKTISTNKDLSAFIL